VGAHWVYNWNINPLENLPAGVGFIPMIYNRRSDVEQGIARVKAQVPVNRYSALLGFNEPDAKTQGNTSVDKALELWPKLEAASLRLGSPGCVHPDNEWMIAFMKGVEERRLRVDFVCVHSYAGPGVESLIKKIEKVHALYKRPIWITEFAVADFVAKVLPKIEALDIVERYSWFHGGVSGSALASSKLFNPDGSLTAVGEAYRSVG